MLSIASTPTRTPTHLVEFPEVLFLSLVNDGENTGDGFANNSATKTGASMKTAKTVLTKAYHSGPDPDLIGQGHSPTAHPHSPKGRLTQPRRKVRPGRLQ